MADLNLDLDYFTHPKTVRTVALLGVGSDVLPIKLWNYCGKYHASDGLLLGYTNEAIESCVGWRGVKGRMVEVFVMLRWLHELKDDSGAVIGYEVHDWLEHQGHLDAFKKRGRTAAKARWAKIAGKNLPPDATSNATSIPVACNKHTSSNAPTVPTYVPIEEPSPPREAPPDSSNPSLAEVLTFCRMGAGIPDDCGTAFFNSMDACGWIDRAQRPVVRWQPLLQNYAIYWRANEAKDKAADAASRPQATLKPAHQTQLKPKVL